MTVVVAGAGAGAVDVADGDDALCVEDVVEIELSIFHLPVADAFILLGDSSIGSPLFTLLLFESDKRGLDETQIGIIITFGYLGLNIRTGGRLCK